MIRESCQLEQNFVSMHDRIALLRLLIREMVCIQPKGNHEESDHHKTEMEFAVVGTVHITALLIPAAPGREGQRVVIVRCFPSLSARRPQNWRGSRKIGKKVYPTSW